MKPISIASESISPVSESTSADALRQAYRDGLPRAFGLEPSLAGALDHLLSRPGSLARARLVDGLMRAWGRPAPEATALALAVEYWHTASLVLDDLPCMDDAAERRGEACVHHRFGEAPALLAALALLNRAYALAWSVLAAHPESRRERAAACLEECLGVAGILNGQALDLSYPRRPADAQEVLRVADGKTGALLRLALELPALLGGGWEGETLRRVTDLAQAWGRVYQIQDDFLDCLVSSAESGKTNGRDLALGRPNLVIAKGLDPALRMLVAEQARASCCLDDLPLPAPALTLLRERQAQFEERTESIRARLARRARL